MLDFRIDTFMEVCKCMNYTRAAEELHITQPAVSQHIRYLEERYNTKLFQKEGKRIVLTPAGRILHQTVAAMQNDENLMRELMHAKGDAAMPMHFGVTMTIGEYMIAKPLAAYMSNHPGVQVRMLMANTAELLEGLKSGDIQFALIEGDYSVEEFESLTYSTEDFIPVCGADYSLGMRMERLRDLLSQHLLVREPGSGTRNILEKILEVNNLQINDFSNVSEISSMHTIVQLLTLNCGISFLYKAAVQRELQQGILREIHLSDFCVKHDFTFIWNKGSVYADIYRGICQELQQARSL